MKLQIEMIISELTKCIKLDRKVHYVFYEFEIKVFSSFFFLTIIISQMTYGFIITQTAIKLGTSYL